MVKISEIINILGTRVYANVQYLESVMRRTIDYTDACNALIKGASFCYISAPKETAVEFVIRQTPELKVDEKVIR